MSQKEITSFGYLGDEYQLKIISQIIGDKTFGLNIIDIINPNYFDNQYYKQIVNIIKNYNEKFDNALPSFSGLREAVLADTKDDIQKQSLLAVLEKINKISLEDDEATQIRALNFCRQQEVLKGVKKIMDIVEKGDFENYNQLEDIVLKFMTFTDREDDSIEVNDDIDSVLDDDFRETIPTGIHGLDEKLKGGLGKGELAVFMAALGCGKTSFLTKIANTAYVLGKNVLQIVFEDEKKVIQRKHFTAYTGLPDEELSLNRDGVKQAAADAESKGGKLIIKKCDSLSTTVQHIKQYIRFLRNKGIAIDVLIIDYLDCLISAKDIDDQNAQEALIMRQLESLTSKFELRTWVGVQTNRSGINADVVTSDLMQGSIKRAQIAQVIITAARGLEQKENNLATMAMTKFRFGQDGIIFRDMTFNNGLLHYDTTETNTVSQLMYEENKRQQKEIESRNKAIKALEYGKMQEEKNKI